MSPTDIANALQYVTLPLELIGFTLALIEIRFPLLAARISQVIVSTEKSTSEIDHEVSRAGAIAIIAVFALVAAAIVFFKIPEWLVYGGCGIAGGFSIAHTIAARWVPDRAVGTIGLIMAALGLMGEIYQVWVQLAL